MNRFKQLFALTIATTTLCMMLSSGASADIIYSNVADGMVRNDATTTTSGATADVGKNSGSGSTLRQNAVFVFDLTGVAEITAAEFGAYLTINNVDISGMTASLQGVGYGSTADGWTSTVAYNNSSTPESGNSLIMSTFVGRNNSTAFEAGKYMTTSSGAVETSLIDFLNNRTHNFVYLRVNNNAESSNNGKYWRFATSETAIVNAQPYLNLTVIPEPASLALLGLGGLCLLGGRSRRA